MSGRFAAYLRRGDLETAAPLALLFAVPAALEYVILGMPGLSAATAPLIVIALAAIFGLGWLVSAKLASDVAATQALNRQAAARAEQVAELVQQRAVDLPPKRLPAAGRADDRRAVERDLRLPAEPLV